MGCIALPYRWTVHLARSCDKALPPKAFEPDPKLEAALENLKRAIGLAGRN
jgi:hypothetical protein